MQQEDLFPFFSADDPASVAEFFQLFYLEPEPDHEGADPEDNIPEPLDLRDIIGVPPELSNLIIAALESKRHLIIQGPPGTGKTTLARKIAEWKGGEWVILTATSDWTAHEVIGGYMPDGNGGIRFEPGIILRNFDKTTIIDEFNRADIDRAFGPLFSVLSGQPVMLPYALNPTEDGSPRVELLPVERRADAGPEEQHARVEYAPGPNWRLICTLNTYDKGSLFQMSYALTRRFAWIYLGAPQDLNTFVEQWTAQVGWVDDPLTQVRPEDSDPAIVKIWATINKIRPIGPAPIIDVAQTTRRLVLQSGAPDGPMDWRKAAAHSLMLYVVPQMEGIRMDQARDLGDCIEKALVPPGGPPGELHELIRQLRKEVESGSA